jgi:hypothetical protein
MLELSDYDENEEASAHKGTKNNNNSSGGGNVECVEVNNGIKMANKRSKSLEKEKQEAVRDDEDDAVGLRTQKSALRRPETAPPLLVPHSLVGRSSDSDFVNKEVKSDDDNDDFILSNRHKTEAESNLQATMTWHEHIYRKPPKIPTPYSIIDIMNWGSKPPRFVDTDSSDKNNNNSNHHRSYQNVEPSTLQHLLNLNINSPPKSPRSASNNHHNNNSGISSRGFSFSETSEDESVASDQPLNLCVTKSRDSSPGGGGGAERSSKKRKGKKVILLIRF